jgi:hypothetical protein
MLSLRVKQCKGALGCAESTCSSGVQYWVVSVDIAGVAEDGLKGSAAKTGSLYVGPWQQPSLWVPITCPAGSLAHRARKGVVGVIPEFGNLDGMMRLLHLSNIG